MTTKSKPNRLTDEQRDLFDGYITEWQERLGLQDWRVERTSKPTRHMAEIKLHYPARLAVYRTGDFGAETITPASLESAALHELLHVLLGELVNQIEWGVDDLRLQSAEHRVVNVLEKLLLKAT